MDLQRRLNREASAKRAALGMGWFSLALGAAELLCARPIARALGMQGREGLPRLYGLREIASGLGIFAAARKPAPWMWGRVAGDALDLATLAAAVSGNPRKAQIALAFAAVAGATAVDVATARELTELAEAPRLPVRDYTGRTGFPRAPQIMRGAALSDFRMPRDMRRVPELFGLPRT